MRMRLEAVDPQHPQTVALVYGPLVLFAITHARPVLTRADLLAARKYGPAKLASKNCQYANQDAAVY